MTDPGRISPTVAHVVSLAGNGDLHPAERYELREALDAMPRDRSMATVHERAAWHHDIGEHEGSDHPYAYCPRCAMEHPEGEFARACARIKQLSTITKRYREALIDVRHALVTEFRHQSDAAGVQRADDIALGALEAGIELSRATSGACPGPAPPQTAHDDAPQPSCPECGHETDSRQRAIEVAAAGIPGQYVPSGDDLRRRKIAESCVDDALASGHLVTREYCNEIRHVEHHAAWRHAGEMERDAAAAKQELGELRALLDLQQRRMTEATEAWRAEAPDERELVMPDLGDLLTWLMTRAGLREPDDEWCARCRNPITEYKRWSTAEDGLCEDCSPEVADQHAHNPEPLDPSTCTRCGEDRSHSAHSPD